MKTLHQNREESFVLGQIKNQNHAQMVIVLSMESGEPGHLGHHVRVIVQGQDLGNVTLLHQEMEGSLVLELVKSQSLVQMDNVL